MSQCNGQTAFSKFRNNFYFTQSKKKNEFKNTIHIANNLIKKSTCMK